MNWITCKSNIKCSNILHDANIELLIFFDDYFLTKRSKRNLTYLKKQIYLSLSHHCERLIIRHLFLGDIVSTWAWIQPCSYKNEAYLSLLILLFIQPLSFNVFIMVIILRNYVYERRHVYTSWIFVSFFFKFSFECIFVIFYNEPFFLALNKHH